MDSNFPQQVIANPFRKWDLQGKEEIPFIVSAFIICSAGEFLANIRFAIILIVGLCFFLYFYLSKRTTEARTKWHSGTAPEGPEKRNDAAATILRLVAGRANVSSESLSNESSFREELNMPPGMIHDLVGDIEIEFDVSIEGSEVKEIHTIGELIARVLRDLP